MGQSPGVKDLSWNLPDLGENWPTSPLVSQLQFQFWPLEGVGPKLQGPGPESFRFVGSSGILKYLCRRGPQEPDFGPFPEFTAGEIGAQRRELTQGHIET